MWYPQDKAMEVVKIFTKLWSTGLKLSKRVGHGPYGTSTGSGFKVVNILEVENSKVYEALMELGKYFANFQGVQGVTWQIEPVMSIRESLSTFGMKPPGK
jgi:hypothetical protein